jgi:biopolymer transport protein ExbD
MNIPRRRRKPVSIDMSPLIDCIFQLLIFFMLSSTFLTPAIKLTLPSAAAVENVADQFVMVTLAPENETFVNKEPVTADQLETKIRTALASAKEKVVTIRGDGKMPYERFVRTLEAARKAGAENVNVSHQVPD